MIYLLLSLIMLFWIVGLVTHIGGAMIHLLLVAAFMVILIDGISPHGRAI